jgi:cell division protein FtsL|tara:strand:- start:6256 stop:6594 length:339 start_codon:yes stop_codon:yes gene_type:complete
MFFWITQQVIISLVIIALIHSIYGFLQNNLTTPKIRDLVNKPSEQYNEIYNSIKEVKEEEKVIPTISMKNELQNYLKELSSTDAPTKTPQKNNEIPQAGTFSNNFSSMYETI